MSITRDESQEVSNVAGTNLLPRAIKKYFASNLRHQWYDLVGLRYLVCFFCEKFWTPIEFDMDLHIHQYHRRALFKDLPLKGGGMTRDVRLSFVFRMMRRRARLRNQVMTRDCWEWGKEGEEAAV